MHSLVCFLRSIILHYIAFVVVFVYICVVYVSNHLYGSQATTILMTRQNVVFFVRNYAT